MQTVCQDLSRARCPWPLHLRFPLPVRLFPARYIYAHGGLSSTSLASSTALVLPVHSPRGLKLGCNHTVIMCGGRRW